jgi:hypothetical protein
LAFIGLGGRLYGGSSKLRGSIADESVLVGFVFGVEGDLDAHDLSVLGELFVQVFAGEVLRNLSHEDVFLHQLYFLVAQEFRVEGKGSAAFSFNDWVLEFFKHLLEAFLVVDLDHGGIEEYADVSLDLGFNVDVDSSLVLDVFGDLYFGD